MDTLQIVVQNLSDLKQISNPKTVWSYLLDLSPLIAGLVGMLYSYLQFKKSLGQSNQQFVTSLNNSNQQFKESFNQSVLQKSIEDERKEIYKKLNEFYGPLLQHREKSSLLYERFRKSYYPKDEKFRTLDYLLKGHKFAESELSLLDEIISIGKECETLVQTNAGLVDDRKLRYEILPKFTAHILILRLAYEKKLIGTPEDFEMHRFPRELDKQLKKQINRLLNRLDELNKGK